MACGSQGCDASSFVVGSCFHLSSLATAAQSLCLNHPQFFCPVRTGEVVFMSSAVTRRQEAPHFTAKISFAPLIPGAVLLAVWRSKFQPTASPYRTPRSALSRARLCSPWSLVRGIQQARLSRPTSELTPACPQCRHLVLNCLCPPSLRPPLCSYAILTQLASGARIGCMRGSRNLQLHIREMPVIMPARRFHPLLLKLLLPAELSYLAAALA